MTRWNTSWRFQYPLMDRLGFWGIAQPYVAGAEDVFQYPLMDRLGFWGRLLISAPAALPYFSIR